MAPPARDDTEAVGAEAFVAFAAYGFFGEVEALDFGREAGEGGVVDEDFAGFGGGFQADDVGDGDAGVLVGAVGARGAIAA